MSCHILVIEYLGRPYLWIYNINSYSVGLDFVIIIIFTALVASFYDGKDSIFPWIIAAVFSYFSFLFIPGKWYIVTGGLTGALVYSFQKYFKEGKK